MFQNLVMLPHAYIFIINMIIVLLTANSEINSRVASTCPFYFYAFSQLIIEVYEEMKKNQKMTIKHGVVLLMLAYNTVVMVLNLLLFTVEIGFV